VRDSSEDVRLPVQFRSRPISEEGVVEAESKSKGEGPSPERRIEEFLAMLAHELRNPLAALSAALALRDKADPDDPRMHRLQRICNRQVESLARIIDDLLETSRITTGHIELQRRTTDLVEIVHNSVQTVRPRILARHHTLSVVAPEAGLMIDADPTRLEQALANLLENAAKYTEPAGKIEVRVETEQRHGVPWARVRVVDSGRGIPPEMLNRIFDLFAQAHSTIDRAAGGLGVGLTLARELVGLHGGELTASSAGLGKGSEFVVALPLLHQKGDAKTGHPAAALDGDDEKRRILIVEDNEEIRESVRELIEDLGHEVAVAADGASGLNKLVAMKPDIALVDIGLPAMDGYQLAERARKAVGPDPYLVALTGYADSRARARSQQSGFDLHLVKPLKLDALLSVLHQPRRSTNRGAKNAGR
jgi:CheY-like chemotaxis protein